jgi:SAM-dependent methyltransferase
MADSYSSKLQIWEGWVPAITKAPTPSAAERPLGGPQPQDDFAARLFARETLLGDGRAREAAEPFTLQWFLDIENARHRRCGKWIPRLLEFAKHGGETLLGLGNGLGTDWVQYARHGADVVVCSPSRDQLALAQRNFELRGLRGLFLHADPAALPLEPASIDVVCLSSPLDDCAEPRAVVEAVYRVLKPGGKVLAVTPARYDIDFWCRRWLPWHHGFGRRAAPGTAALRCSGRALRRLFQPFVEHRVYKRHLRRAEVPHLWRWLPLPLLERLFGRFLVLKAFKPLSAAITVPLAA